MGNLSTVASVGAGVTALSGLVMVTPQQAIGYQPQPINVSSSQSQAPALPTLVFNYEGEQTVSLDSDITDHYIEDNTALQDQIALRPVTITTHGYIGELNDIGPKALQVAKTIANKLGAISAYTPALSASALLAYNNAFQAYQTIASAANAGISAVSSISGNGSQQVSKQQSMFQQFYGYWNARFLFTVQTPWAVFPNCAIMSLKAVQDEATNVITDFNVTFKQLQFATTQVTVNGQGQYNAQASAQVPGGLVPTGPSVDFNPAAMVGK